jgi:hypothetical protein
MLTAYAHHCGLRKNKELPPMKREENQKNFEELHNGCIEEFKPVGRLEEEVVLAIAKCIWRKAVLFDPSVWDAGLR